MQANERELALALRGGLRGRFQNSFHLLETALEVLEDQMQHCITPAQYETLKPLFVQVQEQMLLLRRLGEHSADAAVAPLLHRICSPRPMDLLGQLREAESLFNEIAVQEQLPVRAQLEVDADLQTLLTMGDDMLFAGLLSNLLSNSLSAGQTTHITLACGPGLFCYRDDGPGMEPDARTLLQDGIWSGRLLEQGGLGLPLIRAYASAMGWQMTTREGTGTCVEFVLPPCTVNMEEIVLESAAVTPHLREQQRAYMRRELYPALKILATEMPEGTT